MTNGGPSSGWTHATMRFEATGNSTWSGQFRGCAELVIGQDKTSKMEDYGGKLRGLELVNTHKLLACFCHPCPVETRVSFGTDPVEAMSPSRRPFMILNRDSHGPINWTHPATAAPDWTKHMVVYEIAPRGFTSPNGTVLHLLPPLGH